MVSHTWIFIVARGSRICCCGPGRSSSSSVCRRVPLVPGQAFKEEETVISESSGLLEHFWNFTPSADTETAQLGTERAFTVFYSGCERRCSRPGCRWPMFPPGIPQGWLPPPPARLAQRGRLRGQQSSPHVLSENGHMKNSLKLIAPFISVCQEPVPRFFLCKIWLKFHHFYTERKKPVFQGSHITCIPVVFQTFSESTALFRRVFSLCHFSPEDKTSPWKHICEFQQFIEHKEKRIWLSFSHHPLIWRLLVGISAPAAYWAPAPPVGGNITQRFGQEVMYENAIAHHLKALRSASSSRRQEE